MAPVKLPSSVFGMAKQEATLTEAEFEDVCSKTPHWANLAPGTIKQCSLAWRLAMEAEGRWRRMSSSWLSLLVQPGSVVVSVKEGACHLVLCASRHGFLTWRTLVQKDRRLVLAPIPNRSAQLFWAQSVEDCRAAEVHFEIHPATADKPGTCELMFHGNAHSMVKFACLCGFKGMSVAHLGWLHGHLQVQTSGARPRSEAALLASLCRHVLGDSFSQSVLEAATSARHEVGGTHEDLLQQSDLCKPELKGTMDDECDDDRGVQQQWEDLKKARRRQAQRRAAKLDEVRAATVPASSAGAASPGGSSIGHNGKHRQFVPVPERGPTVQVARRYLPEGFTLSKDTARENRCRLRGALPSGERSRSFGRGSQMTNWSPLVVLLELAWHEHTAATGDHCPWQFAGMAL